MARVSRRRWRAWLGLTVACALLAGEGGLASVHVQAPSTPATASRALQRGIMLMETRGDCVAAIPEFEIARKAVDAPTAARALLLRGVFEPAAA